MTWGAELVALAAELGVLVAVLSEAEPVVRVMTSVTVCAELRCVKNESSRRRSGKSSWSDRNDADEPARLDVWMRVIIFVGRCYRCRRRDLLLRDAVIG